MCNRHSFILTRAGKVLDGIGITDSHTEIRELHGLKHTDDTVNAYEWQPPKGWPETDWLAGLTKDTEVFTPKASHLKAMERHVKKIYPTMAAWEAGDVMRLPKPDIDMAQKMIASSEFVTVPETTLPSGLIVPSFRVGKYVASKGPDMIPVSIASEKPWSKVSYHMATAVCSSIGLNLIRESQALAIAYDISQQDINWTGGKVGEGKIYQGIHQGSVNEAMAGNYEPKSSEDRRWYQLSNGERIYDFAGNIYTWVFDDIQGDEKGIVANKFSKDSPSISTAPYPSMTKGMGWRPDAGSNWSGYALVRGGCWLSESYAGVFALSSGSPGIRDGNVGFRCTTQMDSDHGSQVAA